MEELINHIDKSIEKLDGELASTRASEESPKRTLALRLIMEHQSDLLTLKTLYYKSQVINSRTGTISQS